MSRPTIVLTGAGGRLGVPVHRTLLEARKEVRAVDWVRTPLSDPSVVRVNLYRPRDCRRLFQGAHVLIHLAYRREPLGYPNGYSFRTFDDHMRLNRQVFLAACEAGIKKIIFASSIQVVARQLPVLTAIQPPRYLPLDENSPPEPDNWYSLVKRNSEEMLAMLHQQFGIDYVALRFPSLCNLAPPPHIDYHNGRLSEAFSYLSHLDAAKLILKLVEIDLPGGRIYLPASRRNTLGLPAAEIIRKHYAGIPLRKPVDEIESLVDISAITRETGWEPLELSQPEAGIYTPLAWRIFRRIERFIPRPLKPFLERLFSLFE